jgi:hypothetical protein
VLDKKYIGFCGLLFIVLWILVPILFKINPLGHAIYDGHSLQAKMWLDGRVSLSSEEEVGWGWQEVSRYKNKTYISFPPTGTLMEIPGVLLFGVHQSPNNLILLITAWLSTIMGLCLLTHFLKDKILALLFTFLYFFGTQFLYVSAQADIWYQGHVFHLFFSLLAFVGVIFSNRTLLFLMSGVSFGLALGARPNAFFQVLFLIGILWLYRDQRKMIIPFMAGCVAVVSFLMLYNWVRFDNLFEFGHSYLNYNSANTLPGGIFSFQYLFRNLNHIFLQLPGFDSKSGLFGFHHRGVAIWLVAPAVFIGLKFMWSKKQSSYLKSMFLISMVGLWIPLLLHHSNGWIQFGYRFGIDVLPLSLIGLCLSGYNVSKYGKWGWSLLAVCTVAINFYGGYWFYVLNRFPEVY